MRSRSATVGSCRPSSTATSTRAATDTGTSCAASTCSGTGATWATNAARARARELAGAPHRLGRAPRGMAHVVRLLGPRRTNPLTHVPRHESQRSDLREPPARGLGRSERGCGGRTWSSLGTGGVRDTTGNQATLESGREQGPGCTCGPTSRRCMRVPVTPSPRSRETSSACSPGSASRVMRTAAQR